MDSESATTSAQNHPSPPPEHSIVPRDVIFNFSDDTPRLWFGGDVFKTHFYNAFFTTFPPGESFFVRSVLHYRDQINNEKLQDEISGFASQEGIHANAHDIHLDILDRQGYTSLKRENKFVDAFLKRINRRYPKFALAYTVALEHFTALLAHQSFIKGELFVEPAHEDFRPLMMWHGAEEIEHKAVAFDVYQIVDGSYGMRVTAMVLATMSLLFMIPVRMMPLLYKDGVFFKLSTWRTGWSFLFGKQGKFVMPWHHYIQFYRRDFHPWDVQDFDLIENFRREWDEGKFIGKAETSVA